MALRHFFGPPASRAGVVLTLLSIAACAGNGKGLDANGQPLAGGSSGSLPPLSAGCGAHGHSPPEKRDERLETGICRVRRLVRG